MTPKELQQALRAILPTVQKEADAERVEAVGIIIVAPNGAVSQFLATTSAQGAMALSEAGTALRDAADSMTIDVSRVN
jgi:hypothetical protein